MKRFEENRLRVGESSNLRLRKSRVLVIRVCGFPRVANLVNDACKKAVHQGLLSEDEARTCLQNAREALQLLLRR